MPRIFDNLASDTSLLPALQETLDLSSRADFCVGYFNLRGWGGLAPLVDRWQPGEGPCRVLIGMQRLPHEDLRDALGLVDRPLQHGQPNGAPPESPVGRTASSAAHDRCSHQRRRADPTAISWATSIQEGRRQALPAPPAARKALPSVSQRSHKPYRRLPGKQQPDLRRSVGTGRVERGRSRPRRYAQAQEMVRGQMETTGSASTSQTNCSRSSRIAGRGRH